MADTHRPEGGTRRVEFIAVRRLLVIGWGKAGKTLAKRYAGTGKRVALVEQDPAMYGGTCINVACVPTKDLVASAEARRPTDDAQEYFTRSVADRDALIGTLNAGGAGGRRPDPGER